MGDGPWGERRNIISCGISIVRAPDAYPTTAFRAGWINDLATGSHRSRPPLADL